MIWCEARLPQRWPCSGRGGSQCLAPNHPRKDSIAHARKPLVQFFDCKARQQDARILNLYAVVKYCHSSGGAALGIVGMHNGIHQCFTQGCGRDSGHLAAL
jgi:hypothetical protein